MNREAIVEAFDDPAFETLADVQTSIGPLRKAMSIRRRRSYLDAVDSHHRPMMLRLESDELRAIMLYFNTAVVAHSAALFGCAGRSRRVSCETIQPASNWDVGYS